MTPTPKLRWVERTFKRNVVDNDGRVLIKDSVVIGRILQQWWEDQSTDVHWVNGNPGEWIDVPLEDEK